MVPFVFFRVSIWHDSTRKQTMYVAVSDGRQTHLVKCLSGEEIHHRVYSVVSPLMLEV